LLFGAALCLLIAIVVSKFAVKAGVPVLLLFLGIGMLIGSDGLGGVYFDNPALAQSIGVVALAFIIFSGGLDTSWRDMKRVLRPGLALSTLGVTITAVSVGIFAALALGFSLAEGVLLGAIISSTDAAAVFAVLRGKNVHLKGRLKPLLELESGSNDPMAVFLTLGMIQIVTMPEQSVLSLIPFFIQQMGIGALAGYAIGTAAVAIINRLRLEYDGLYPVLTVALVMFTYGATAVIGGNGFLAVYIVGLVMGRANFIHKRSLVQFHDGVAWLMQITMFVTLGLQVFPSQLPEVAVAGIATAAFLIFIARPLSVILSLSLSRFRWREKHFISWVGLRGAAPIVLATFPLLARVEAADYIFHLVFFIVLTSVLLQGTLMIPIARLLRVYNENARGPRSPLAYVLNETNMTNDLIEVTIQENSQADGRQILDLNLPADVLVVLIGRGSDMIVPRGATILEAGDRVLMMVNRPSRPLVHSIFEVPALPNGKADTR
jgi:cell volume regulation protein A